MTDAELKDRLQALIDTFVQDERVAVVAWLGAQLPDIDICGCCGQLGTTVDSIADAIERGEHRREEEP